jgi:hypothetical protein
MMRAFSRLTVLIAAIAPVAVVAMIALCADPAGRMVQRLASMIQSQWLLVGLLLVVMAPWPALAIAAIERDHRRQSRASGSNRSGA